MQLNYKKEQIYHSETPSTPLIIRSGKINKNVNKNNRNMSKAYDDMDELMRDLNV